MNTPEERADRLVAALHENTEALERVKSRYRLSFIVIVLLAATLVYVVYSGRQNDLASCNNNNAVREDIDAKFGSIAEFLDGAISDTPENQMFIEIVGDNIAPRNCSDIGWFG